MSIYNPWMCNEINTSHVHLKIWKKFGSGGFCKMKFRFWEILFTLSKIWATVSSEVNSFFKKPFVVKSLVVNFFLRVRKKIPKVRLSKSFFSESSFFGEGKSEFFYRAESSNFGLSIWNAFFPSSDFKFKFLFLLGLYFSCWKCYTVFFLKSSKVLMDNVVLFGIANSLFFKNSL